METVGHILVVARARHHLSDGARRTCVPHAALNGRQPCAYRLELHLDGGGAAGGRSGRRAAAAAAAANGEGHLTHRVARLLSNVLQEEQSACLDLRGRVCARCGPWLRLRRRPLRGRAVKAERRWDWGRWRDGMPLVIVWQLPEAEYMKE